VGESDRVCSSPADSSWVCHKRCQVEAKTGEDQAAGVVDWRHLAMESEGEVVAGDLGFPCSAPAVEEGVDIAGAGCP
jgi:hypothetical protein